MTETVELWEKPEAEDVVMMTGWRQWADAGSVSSELPHYLINQTSARPIGKIRPDGFYLFQVPGTHDLVRPVVKFVQGYPESLQTQRNELYYSEHNGRGVVFFTGDEPQMDVERYIAAILEVAKTLRVKRIVGFGGVYGELPYDKDRMVSSVYSLKHMKEELSKYSVTLSDYQGGASIGSYLCKRAGEQNLEYAGFYAFVPAYHFSDLSQFSNTISIEVDHMAWLAVMQRVNHMLKLDLDLSDLEQKSEELVQWMDRKVEELDKAAPQLNAREYIKRLSDEFHENSFNPLDDVWENELRRLMDKYNSDAEE